MRNAIKILAVLILFCVPGRAQQVQQGNVQLDRSGPAPIYKVTVVERTIQAVNYRVHSGSTKVDFHGTPLMPDATGKADVDSKQGRTAISTKMDHLSAASQLGPEYVTYVMWAITPEGLPKNLGEVLLDGDKGKLDVTTDLQTFGLIVTAEPYFAVSQPSDVVVMENFVRSDTEGNIKLIEAKYELLQRGQYVVNVNPSQLTQIPFERKAPLDLYEAENAVRIAGWAGAQQYAPDAFEKAKESLQTAEDELSGKAGKKTVAQNSRDATQAAEDARLIAVRRIEDEQTANEKAAANEAAAQAESARASAEQAKTEAEHAKIEAQIEADRATREKNDADAARVAALAQQQATQAALDQTRQAAAQAEDEKAQLRDQLRDQLNVILETRETARGLIVNMSDVLFDTGKYSLTPGAREKLAKVSGILLAHPGLMLEVEGHTDSVGSDDYNQQLSEQRSGSVRSYLVSQGIPPNAVTAIGLGKAEPVADNSTAAGRQQNRRVEIVVSGDVIGIDAGPVGQLTR